jgi:hypothetical protein
MGKLLTILGITDQSNLTEDVLTAENLIIGMQYIYENSPESEQKESLAIAIAETIRLTLQQIKGLPLTPPQAPQVFSNKPRILTEVEMAVIYGLAWRTEVALDNKNEIATWVSPAMDKYFGNELTQKQIDDLGTRDMADVDLNFVISLYMTTLNPKFNNQQSTPTPPPQTIVQVGDIFKHATETKHPPYYVVNIQNDKVTIAWTKNSMVRQVDYDLQDVIDYIDNGNWIRVNNQQATPKFKVGDWVISSYKMIGRITDCEGTAPNFTYDGVKFNGTTAFAMIPENLLQKVDLADYMDSFNVKAGNIFKSKNGGNFIRILETTKDKIVTLSSDNEGNITEFNIDEFIVLLESDVINYVKDGDRPLYKVGDVVTWGSDLRDMTITSIQVDGDGGWFYVGDMENGKEDGTFEGMLWLSTKKTLPQPTKPTAKKGTRQSPQTSANDVKEGTKMKGIDGNMWVSKKTSAGYKQWKKIK